MNKNLYPCFKWPGAIWLYSDPHFGDPEMKYFRPESVDDNFQIKQINSKVGKSDTLIILGDIGNEEKIQQLKGYKILIKGNHDKGSSNYLKYFDEVYDGCLLINDKIILSHEPVDFDYAFNIHGHDHSGFDFINYVLKYYDADMNSKDMINNYLDVIKKENLNKLNICAEWINYTPLNLNKIIKSGVLHNVKNIHKVTISNAKDKKLSKTSC